MTVRESRWWARLLAWFAAAALLLLAAYAVYAGVNECERRGGHYEGPNRCTTPSGVHVPHG